MRLEHLTTAELIRVCEPQTELEKLLLERLTKALSGEEDED